MASNPAPAQPERREPVIPPVPPWLQIMAGWGWRLGVVGGLVWLAWRGAATVLVVTLPLIVALILATLCIPARAALTNRGLKPAPATMIVVVGGLAALIGMFAGLAPQFVEQISELGPTVVAGRDEFLAWLQDGPLGIDQAQLQDLLARAQELLSSGGGEGGAGVVTGVLTGVSTVTQFLAGLALTLVLLFFIVKDYPQLLDWIRRMLPAQHRPVAAAMGQRAWTALAGYVRGTALIALIDAIGVGIGLAIVGVPLVLPLAVLVFFGAFLPVIGAFLAGLVAVLVALADGGVSAGLIVLAIILAVQQIEGNFLHPTIMRRAVALHPIVVLMALTAGAALGGIIGAFLSVPFAAVAAAIGNEVRLRAEAGLLDRRADDVPDQPIGPADLEAT